MILRMLTAGGLVFEKEVKREPAGAEFIKRVWTEPFFEDCVFVTQSTRVEGMTVLSRHVVAFKVVDD